MLSFHSLLTCYQISQEKIFSRPLTGRVGPTAVNGHEPRHLVLSNTTTQLPARSPLLALPMALLHPSLSSRTAWSSYFCLPKSQSLVDPSAFVRFSAAGHCFKNGSILKSGSNRAFTTVRSSSETAAAAVGQVTEVNKDTFWPVVEAAGRKTVVLDMYTQWCGPCKVMAPKFQELSQKYLDVVFLKLDCNEENKPLAKELGIRAVPTFKILKDGKVVKEVTGAKLGDLVLAIETVESS